MRVVYLLFSCVGLLFFRQIGDPGAAVASPVRVAGAASSDRVAGIATLPPNPPAVQATLDYFKKESSGFAASASSLRTAIQRINNKDPHTVTEARKQLLACRLQYKKIEFFLEYFFRSSSRVFNSAPKYEQEEPDMEYQSPLGLQVIEALLFEAHPWTRKKELLQQADVVAGSASVLPGFLYEFHATDQQLLESLRLELVRIITLGITGYDAPLLKSGIAESCVALQSLQYQLQAYPRQDSLWFFLDGAIGRLNNAVNRLSSGHVTVPVSIAGRFDGFDRMGFLTGAALPLQHALGAFIRQNGLELNTNGVINYSAADIFSPDALMPESFPAEDKNDPGDGGGSDDGDRDGRVAHRRQDMITLGRRLFLEPALSDDGSRSCATCHSPEKEFCDRLPTPLTLDGHGHLPRNAPSLLYSSFQYVQFWDGRARTLEDQIRTVLGDPQEMKADYRQIAIRLKSIPGYDSLARLVFPDQENDWGRNIARSIATYLRTLHPMNSPFDHYIRGDKAALSPRQINGANLFMGKAQCATCHFIPLFNGLIPPDYARTEFEVLGTTATDQFKEPRPSKDQGRFTVYPFAFYKGAFKTPTLRNVASTQPYMHNGAFSTLRKVMEFYNKGGGAGLGLHVPEQTLPSQPLHLDQREMDDIVLFMQALTDENKTLNLSVTSNH